MSIVIKNLQKAAIINTWQVRKDLITLRNIMGLQSFDVGLLFLSKNKMRELNYAHRKIDEATDILSFPFHQSLTNADISKMNLEEKNLGDIFLCPQLIRRKYDVHDFELRSVFVPLLTHGLVHLCGYAHETEEQYELMHTKELEILKRFEKYSGKRFLPS
ncbi:endoribonuclease YbeY [Hydra vulgaris]|uniref:Endoribonuclease YbeY n=1 Tax=Hydra vulgaris TaxID=6087 RepID=A0ABM4D467_HYDVU